MEFTGVELAAPVEKGVTGPRAGEGCGGREVQRGRKIGCRAWARWRCRSVERRRDREGGTMESMVVEAAWRSTVVKCCRSATVR